VRITNTVRGQKKRRKLERERSNLLGGHITIEGEETKSERDLKNPFYDVGAVLS